MKKLLTLFILMLSGIAGKAQWVSYSNSNSGLNSDLTWFVYEDANHYLWVATNNGLNRYNIATGMWTSYTTSNSGISSNDIHGLVSDNSGNLWVATFGGGICKYDGSNWTVFNTANSALPVDEFYHIKYDSISNSIWAGSRYGGLVKYNINTQQWTIYDSFYGLYDSVIDDVAFAPNGDVWIACRYQGVARFNGSNFIYYTVANSGIAGDDIYSIAVDGLGHVWAGATTGLSLYDGQNWTNYTTSNSSLSGNYIRQIQFDALNNPWISSGGGGIMKFNGSTVWTTYNSSNSNIPSNMVWSSILSGTNSIWIATYGGGIAVMDSLQHEDSLWTRKAIFPPVAPTIFTGIAQNPNDQTANEVYPNPSTQFIYINTTAIKRIEIRDLSGRQIFKAAAAPQIDISSLASGFYLIACYDASGILQKQLRWTKE